MWTLGRGRLVGATVNKRGKWDRGLIEEVGAR